jgi:hypothetical protein
MRNECIEVALAELEAVGIRDVVVAHGSKHPQLRFSINGGPLHVFAVCGTPSDHRSSANTRRDLRKLLRERAFFHRRSRSRQRHLREDRVMSVPPLLPKRRRGRQSLEAEAEYREQVVTFCALIQKIRFSMDFSVGSRGWCYILERHDLRKGDFDAAERLIIACRKSGDLPLDICAEDSSRETIGVEQIPDEVESWVRSALEILFIADQIKFLPARREPNIHTTAEPPSARRLGCRRPRAAEEERYCRLTRDGMAVAIGESVVSRGPTTHLEKLAKYVRLLRSDREHEVAASLRALKRTLKSCGEDFCDSGNRIENANGGSISEEEMQRILDAGIEIGICRAEEEHRHPNSQREVDGEADRWHRIAVFCQQNPKKRLLYENEPGFVADMIEQTADGVEPSPKQKNWLGKIFRRLGERL